MLLTVKQAAEQLGLAERTIYALCQSNMLKHHRLGPRRGAIRITQQAIDDYLNPAPQVLEESLLDWRRPSNKKNSRSSDRIAG